MKMLQIIFFCIFMIGCNKPTLTPEQTVFESLFLERIGNTYGKIYIASATENEWFLENPISSFPWESTLNDLGGISMDLVEELYRVNKKSYRMSWQPILTNAEFLPESFATKAKTEGRDIRCLVNNGAGNIRLRKPGQGDYRSYYTVSKVAFSRNRKIALLKFSYLCAPLSGAGEFFVSFEFKDKRWQVIGGNTLWIS